jgi:hypothetical protein
MSEGRRVEDRNPLASGKPGGPPPLPALLRVALIVIVAFAMTVAGWWVLRVPVFEAPDEDTHFDYVVSLLMQRRLLFADERPVAEITQVSPFAPYSHPYTWHLAIHTRAHEIRFRYTEKVPPGYGTAAFFERLDREAPALDPPPQRNPWLVPRYPVGYYALTALWVGALRWVHPGVVSSFFLARFFSVVLLGIGMVASFGTLRRLGCGNRGALAMSAGLGLFPLSIFVCSSVQPDALSFALVPLTLWAALRVRDRAASGIGARDLLTVGLSLGLTLVTKLHVFATMAPPVLAMLAVRLGAERLRWRQWMRAALALLAPSFVLMIMQLAIDGWQPAWIAGNLSQAARGGLLAQPASAMPEYFVRGVGEAAVNYFGGGTAFETFWRRFGWNDMPVTLGDPALDAALGRSLIAVTVVILLLIVLRLLRLVRTTATLWVRGRRAFALRLATANPLLGCFILYTILMFALYLFDGEIGWQGRHWFPQLLAIFWAAICFAPRALGLRAARRFRGALLAGLLAYDLLVAPLAMHAVRARYYPTDNLAAEDGTIVVDLRQVPTSR